MRTKFLMATAAALVLSLGLTATAEAGTVVATTADAGGTVSVTVGDTLIVKLPGHWKQASDATPELVLQNSETSGKGARGHTELTFSADDTGSTTLSVQNVVTGIKLSMLVDVMSTQ